MSEKPDYGPALFRVLKTVQEFQDSEMTYAERDLALLARNTREWNALNASLVEVLGILAAVNPEATLRLGESMTQLVKLSTELWETADLRVKNASAFVKGIREARAELPETEKKDGGK